MKVPKAKFKWILLQKALKEQQDKSNLALCMQ